MASMRVPLALGLALLSAPLPAIACPVFTPRDPTDVTGAEVVVMGRLTDYEIVPFRRSRDESGWSGGHAQFNLTVERPLVGETPRRIRVRWSNSTFATPEEMPDGVYLVALYPPGRGDGGDYWVFQEPCSGAFLLKAGSSGSVEVLRVLEGLPPRAPDPRLSETAPSPPGGAAAPAGAAPASSSAWTAPWPEGKRIPAPYWITFGVLAAVFALIFGSLAWRRTLRAEDAPPNDDPPASD